MTPELTETSRIQEVRDSPAGGLMRRLHELKLVSSLRCQIFYRPLAARRRNGHALGGFCCTTELVSRGLSTDEPEIVRPPDFPFAVTYVC
jgi:hypothetical protein